MKTLAVFFVPIWFLVVSCDNDDPDRPVQDPIFPMNLGNSWVYDDIRYSNEKPVEQTTYRMEILYSYTIDSKTGFALTKYTEGEPMILLNNDEDGNCVETLFDNGKFIHSTIAFKKNVKKGDKWMYKSTVYTEGVEGYEIEEWEKTCFVSDTIITTPRGSFYCTGYSYHPGGVDSKGNPNHTMIQYLSVNTGLVKDQHYEHDNGKTWLFRERVLTDCAIMIICFE